MVRVRKSNNERTANDTRVRLGSSNPDGGGVANPGGNSPMSLPPKMPQQPFRPTQPGIPQQEAVRARLGHFARQYVEQRALVPPLTLDEVAGHAREVCRTAGVDPAYRNYVGVLVSNEAWRDVVAGIPYDRRLLLLPQCLRADGQCSAPIDEFGLVCQKCGSCLIHYLTVEAERLGYAVLVAEGTAVVTKLIESGRIEAIVGVSCMSVLEKCFPHLEARAVPGLAIPLLQDGCANTSIDIASALEAIHLCRDDRTNRLDLDNLKHEVQRWFTELALTDLLGAPIDETERIARNWLARAGKRWRPYLTACTNVSLQQAFTAEGLPILPDDLKKLAIAVECFHKASLVHDDIEDGDEERYGQKALHAEYGTAVALNVGDFLLGEGYRLIGELDVADRVKVAMWRIAADGHLTLSRGQGAELCWARHPQPLTSLEVLDIFRQKTAPAFEVALRLGAVYGDADEGVHEVLARYSEALGIAYQIRDDLEDFLGNGDSNDLRDLRPSLILAVAHKRARGDAEKELVASLWDRTCSYDDVVEEVQTLVAKGGVIDTVEGLLEAYTAEAIRALHPLKNLTLKGLLRRVIGKVFGNEEMRGYCREFKARHAASRALGAEPAA